MQIQKAPPKIRSCLRSAYLNDVQDVEPLLALDHGAWVPMLRDVIAQVLQLYDAADRDRVLFRAMTDQQWGLIEGRVDRLFLHKIWDDTSPDVIAQLKINAVEQLRSFLTNRGLTVNWILGGEGP